MKIHKIVSRIYQLLVVALLTGVTACEESAPLSIDPVEMVPVFTFEPENGYPSTAVVLTGTGLDAAQAVAIGSKAAEITSQSSTQITFIVPVGALSEKIKVITSNSVIESATEFIVDESPVPLIVEFSPAIAGSGDVVTLSGMLFDRVDSVYVGDLKVENYNEVSPEMMELTMPDGLQTGRIRLYYNYFTDYGLEKVAVSISATDLSLALPAITGITPAINALNIGDVLTISGTMLDEVTEVAFDGIVVIPTSQSENEIVVAVPEGAVSGVITLTVLDGVVESEPFTVILPAITGFTPDKGVEESGAVRNFAVQGTRLDLVNSVFVGSVEANITSQGEDIILFTAPSDAGGSIILNTNNGPVSSEIPFFFTGDFWVNDWDSSFEVVRYSNISNRNLGGLTEEIVSDNGNNFSRLTMTGAVNNNGFYLWGPDVGNDRFSLYTPNPEGVYLEFDLKVTEMADSCKQDDGTFQFKIFTMDALGWGASGDYSYGANSPTAYVATDGEWQHFRMHMAEFPASSNGGLYTTGMPAAGDMRPDAWCHPNSLRILAFVFGTANESGLAEQIVIGLDNVKFVIE